VRRRLSALGIEARPRIHDVDSELRTRSTDANLDRIGLVQAGVPDAVGNDLAHKENRVIDQDIAHAGSQRLEAAPSFGRRIRVRPQTEIDLAEHRDAIPRSSRAANTGPFGPFRTEWLSGPRWGVAGTGRGAVAGWVEASDQVAVGEPAGVAPADRAPVGRAAGAPAPARAERSGSVRSS